MAKLQSIGFDDELHERISAYAEKKNMSFSKATVELAKAGMDLFDKSGSFDTVYLSQRMKEALAKLERAHELLEASETEKIRLWDLLKTMFTHKDVLTKTMMAPFSRSLSADIETSALGLEIFAKDQLKKKGKVSKVKTEDEDKK